jgi:hypothetical protein
VAEGDLAGLAVGALAVAERAVVGRELSREFGALPTLLPALANCIGPSLRSG